MLSICILHVPNHYDVLLSVSHPICLNIHAVSHVRRYMFVTMCFYSRQRNNSNNNSNNNNTAFLHKSSLEQQSTGDSENSDYSGNSSGYKSSASSNAVSSASSTTSDTVSNNQSPVGIPIEYRSYAGCKRLNGLVQPPSSTWSVWRAEGWGLDPQLWHTKRCWKRVFVTLPGTQHFLQLYWHHCCTRVFILCKT